MGWITDLLKEIPSAARYKYELETMEKENTALKAQVDILKTENANLRQEIQRRDDVIQKEKAHDLSLYEIGQKMVFYLKNNPRSSIKEISSSTGIPIQSVRDLLEEYAVNGDAECSFDSATSDPLWTLTPHFPVT
jgi:hypothetical protein